MRLGGVQGGVRVGALVEEAHVLGLEVEARRRTIIKATMTALPRHQCGTCPAAVPARRIAPRRPCLFLLSQRQRPKMDLPFLIQRGLARGDTAFSSIAH